MERLGRPDRGVPSGLDTNGAAWTPMERLGHQWSGLDTNGAAWTPMVRLGHQWCGLGDRTEGYRAAWTPMERLGHQWSGLEQNGPLRADCLMIAYGKAEDLN